MRNLLNYKTIGNEEGLEATDDFDHIEDVEQDILETIEAEVTTEDLEQSLDNAIDDLETIEQGDMELDIIEDQSNQYEAIVTEHPEVVTDQLVKEATERLTFDIANHLGVSDDVIRDKIERKVGKEETFNPDDSAGQLQVLTSSTKGYIEEIRSNFQTVISKLFSQGLNTPNLLKLHADKIKLAKSLLNGPTTGRVINRDVVYSPIAAAYTLCGNDLNELVTYIGNLSTRPIDAAFESIRSGADPMDAFATLANTFTGLNIGTNSVAESSESTGSIDIITSIIGNLFHYVHIYQNDFGIRYKIIEDPFSSNYIDNLNATPISSDSIREILNNIIYQLQDYDSVQSNAIETLGSIANAANYDTFSPDVVKAAMAVAAKTTKGILHAYTYGINSVINICLAEAISDENE